MRIFPKEIPFEVEIPFSTDEFKKKLIGKLNPTIFHTLFQAAFIGKIIDNSVVISHYRPGTRRALSPCFKGEILHENGKAKIKGFFGINNFEKTSILLIFIGIFIYYPRLLFSGYSISVAAGTAIMVLLVIYLLLWSIRFGWERRQDDVHAIQDLLKRTCQK